MTVIFSPALTASSSTSQQKDLTFADFNMEGLGADVDFSDLLNFDEFDSGASSHSPTTISPNHTPSPLPAGPSPFALSADYDYNSSAEFSFNYPLDDKPLPGLGSASGGIPDMIPIKEEPMEFGWPSLPSFSNPAPIPAPAQPIAPAAQPDNNVEQPEMNFAGLPIEQQLALQQLMMNIMNYQTQYGLNNPSDNSIASSSNTSSNNQNQTSTGMGTIQPSMVFSSTPSSATFTSAPSSAGPSTFVSPAQPPQASPQPPQPRNTSNTLMDIPEDEPLQSIEPHEYSRHRSASTFSAIEDVETKIGNLIPSDLIFSAGKGKGGKKGGGLSSVVRMEDEDLDDDDSWRPSPEEYKKLSSKEKRQLRNKLSARAFRTRRKDYISTLEGHIKDRDTVIDAIKEELVSSRTENQDLRRELEALKASTMSILHPESANKKSESPALISALAMAPSLPAVTPQVQVRKGPSATPGVNTRKDLPSSPALLEVNKGFWGGNDMLGGGSTICHTMLTPELTLPQATPQITTAGLQHTGTTSPIRTFANLPRSANINPLLSSVDHHRQPSLAAPASGKDISGTTFQEWSEQNAFSLRSMDAYRMQMWSRLAREAQAEKSGISMDSRPKFFVDPTISSSGGSTSTSSPSTSTTQAEAPMQASAALAGATYSHITSRLANSFWSAFTSPSGSRLDGEKLTAVVTGKARLSVVDNEKTGFDSADDIIHAMGGLKLHTGSGSGSGNTPKQQHGARENPIGAMASLFRIGVAMPTRA